MAKKSLLKHDDLPANVGLVKKVREELRSEIRAVHHDLSAKISGIGAKISGIGAKFSGIDAKFSGIDEKFARVDAKFADVHAEIARLNAMAEKTMASVHRVEVLMEEQRGENKIVLDGLKLVLERQDRVENTLSRHI